MRIERIAPEISRDTQEEIDLTRLDPLISKYKNKKGNLIPLLQGTQNLFGYLPRVAFEKIASETGLELSDMYGVATFYAQFRMKPVGRIIIKICHGTACHVQNANTISDALEESLRIKDGETTEDGLFTLESVACLGCCSLAPVMMVGENTFGKLTGTEAVLIVKNIRMSEVKNAN